AGAERCSCAREVVYCALRCRVKCSIESSSDRREIAMSEPSSVGPEKPAPPKKAVSPVRNIIGLVVLLGVLVYGGFEIAATYGFNSGVAKLAARSENENLDLMTMQEAEALLGKDADGPAVDVTQNSVNYSKKTYTWSGLLKQYTLAAYYTKEKQPHLHHY